MVPTAWCPATADGTSSAVLGGGGLGGALGTGPARVRTGPGHHPTGPWSSALTVGTTNPGASGGLALLKGGAALLGSKLCSSA